MEQLFYELIQVPLGTRICLSRTPSDAEWGELYATAKKQSLVGVCFASVQKLLLQQQEPPEMLYLTWMGMDAKIQQRNEIANAQCVEVQQMIEKEGFLNTVLEAGAMGLASIVTDINGAREIIVEGENGIIIPSKDTAAIFEAMKKMVENDVMREGMASKARKMIEDRFERGFVRKCLYDFYEEVLG